MKKHAFLLSALAVLLLAGAFRSPSPGNAATQQPTKAATAPASPQAITVENAGKVKQLAVLGRGRNGGVAWLGDGKNLAVFSAVGLLVYAADSLTDPVNALPEASQFSDFGLNIATGTGAFSSDGTIFAYSALSFTAPSINFWNTTTGQKVGTLKGDQIAYQFALSPDGKLLAAPGLIDQSVHLFSVPDGKPAGVIKGLGVDKLAFSADGKILVGSGTTSKVIQLWQMPGGKPLKTFKIPGDYVGPFALSPDSKFLATSVSQAQTSQLTLFDVATGAPSSLIKDKLEGSTQFLFSPDSKYLAVNDKDSNWTLWDLSTGQPTALKTKGQADYVARPPVFSPDSKLLVYCGYEKITVWDTSKGELATTLDKTAGCRDVAFSPDGKSLAGVSQAGDIWVWDVASSKLTASRPGDAVIADWLLFSPDSKGLVVGAVGIWDVATGKFNELPAQSEASRSEVGMSADGKTLLYGTGDGTIHAWDVASAKEVNSVKLDGYSNQNQLALSPDGKLAASGNQDQTVSVWDTQTGKSSTTLKGDPPKSARQGGADYVRMLLFSPDNKYLVATQDSGLRLWDVTSGKLLTTVSAKQEVEQFGSTAAFSADSKNLYFNGDQPGFLKIWDIVGNKAKKTVQTDQYVPGTVGVSFDGKLMALGGMRLFSALSLYNAASGKTLTQLVGHSDEILSIVFSPDGNFVATSSTDGTVRLWGLALPSQ